MTLVLQIENYDYLEDGGPIRFTVGPRGCQVGRAGSMDWVLPDPSRHISSHHFDIIVRDGGYWLVDVSTNGTFLQGQRYRLDQPHRLAHMDRFQVGQYIVVVLMGAPVVAQPSAPVGYPAPPAADPWSGGVGASSGGDPWSVGAALDPIDPLPRAPAARREDFADEFISAPVFVEPAPVLTPVAPAVPVAPPVAAPVSPPVPDWPVPSAPMPSPAPMPQVPDFPVLSAAPRPDPALMPRPVPVAPLPPEPRGPAPGAAELVKAFCEGAGLSPAAYGDVDPIVLARHLGQAMRIVATETMGQLQARASVKQFTRGGERTMRQATDNNPLKFLPDADQALEAMFLKFRAGFLTGPDSLAEALRDIRLHQMAVFAAIQPALGQLLGDLAPEKIEAEGGSGGLLSGGKKSKAWDAFVERWDAKTHPHENGILDEFLLHFARAYADCIASNDR